MKITQRNWLSVEENDKKILVRLEATSDSSDMSYLPGDHAAVYPVNSDEEVELVLKHMSCKPQPEDKPVIFEQHFQNEGDISTLHAVITKFSNLA